MNKEYIHNMIYNSGDMFLPERLKYILSVDLIGNSKKTFYVSWWSIVHFINGMLFGYSYLYLNKDIKFYYYKLFILHSLWEMWQALIGMSKPYKLSGRSNLIDIVQDTIFFMVGAYIIRNFYMPN